MYGVVDGLEYLGPRSSRCRDVGNRYFRKGVSRAWNLGVGHICTFGVTMSGRDWGSVSCGLARPGGRYPRGNPTLETYVKTNIFNVCVKN